MDHPHKFSVTEKNSKCDSKQPFLEVQNGSCSLSCENIFVYTRILFHSNSFKQNIPIYTLYIGDINSLYEGHVLLESLEKITFTKFDKTGHHLIVVTSSGNIHFYTKGSSLHQWTNSFTNNWNGEDILLVDFFHPKNKPHIQLSDIKIQSSYTEKFHVKPHQPSLKTTGNCFQNGFFAVSASGLIFCCTVNHDGNLEEESKAVLGPVRDSFEIASASLAPDGKIHIAAWKPDMLKCWEVELKYIENERHPTKEGKIYGGISVNGNRKLKINVQSTQSLTPSLMIPNAGKVKKKGKVTKVSHLQYADNEDPTCLLLVLEMETNSEKTETKDISRTNYIVQKYLLMEKKRVFHKFFSEMSSNKELSESSTIYKEWNLQGEWFSTSKVACLNTSSHFLFRGSSIPCTIVVSTIDGFIHSINRETMNTMSKYNLQNSNRFEEMPAPKRNKSSPKVMVSLVPTWTNLHVLTQDSQGGLHLFNLIRQADVGNQWVISIMLLLEYSLVGDCDWWDILMVTPPNSIVNIIDRFSDTFFQQPQSITNNLLTKFLVLKNSMLRLSATLHQRSIEARLQTQLQASLKLYHSLRPVTADVGTSEKNLSLAIQNYVESRTSLECPELEKAIDTILYSFNILDSQVDNANGRDLQVLLQFTTDLSLYLLLLLVQNPKYELAKEAKTLQYLREILLTARIFHRHNKLVIPQMIRKSDGVDLWAQIYKLLTRLSQIIPNEPDTGFLDDCIVLETQVVCQEMPLFIPPRGVFGCVSHSTSFPLIFEFGQQEQNSSASSINPRPLEGSLPSPKPLDSLCYHYLGANSSYFQCSRCFSVRGNWSGCEEMSMWEQEWATKCICSGYWVPA